MAACSISTLLNAVSPGGRVCRYPTPPGRCIVLSRRSGSFAAGRIAAAGLKVRCSVQQQDDERGKGRGKQQKAGEPAWMSASNLFRAITAGAALQVALEAYLGMDRVQKMVPSKRKRKVQSTMTAEERQRWTQGLPLVEEQIPYTDIIHLRQEGRIKHIIRHPASKLKEDVPEVLVVLDDDRVVRTLLPPTSDAEFWKLFEELKLDKIVTEAYSPPPPSLELPPWALKGPSLLFLKNKIDALVQRSARKPKVKQQTTYPSFRSAAAARLQEMQRERQEKQREMKLQKLRAEAQRKQQKYAEEKKRKKELIRQQRAQMQESRYVSWDRLAEDENVRFALGVFFFWLFYVTVVVGVKKQRQDYEDREKIRKMENEERIKMKELDKQLAAEDDENDQLKAGMRFMKSGAKMRGGRLSRIARGDEADVKFSDVAGLGNIRIELEEIVDFFTHAEKFRKKGCRIPSGILLCGEPGVGKTLLAKAVAGEAGVTFLAISASQFVEIYVGVGASRVRSLYDEAKQNAPAVVFIDELDAVGRMRGLSSGSGAQERDATLNQLLTCLDGFEGKGDIITIAATNRPDILDPALVRPGRFDRKIYIPKPSLQGRVEILQVHARSKPMADDVDYLAVAHMTSGMVGAQLAHLVDVAALVALRDNRLEVTTDDLLEAAQLEEGGEPDAQARSERITNILALHEAAMAAMAVNCPDLRDIQLISILPKMGQEKGFTRFKPDPLKYEHLQSLSRQGFLDHITVQLAGRAADELWNGADKLCTVWCDNVDIARKAAREYVFSGHTDRRDLYVLGDCVIGQEKLAEIDVEAQKIINSCYQRALKFLERNRDFVDALMKRLVAKKTVRPAELRELVDQYAVLDESRLQPIDVQKMKRVEFEQQMMTMARNRRKGAAGTLR